MFQGGADVSEFSFAEYIYYLSRGKGDFLAIPVFPFRRFRQGNLFCLSAKPVDPAALNGKRIGFWEWVQTAAVWQRGTLVEEYGVSPTGTSWCVGSIHHWDDEKNEELHPRNGSVLQRIERGRPTKEESVEASLLEEKIDVLGLPTMPRVVPAGDPRVRRLFGNYIEEEKAYYRKTRIFPIMHTIVVRRSVVERHPEVPEKLFRLLFAPPQPNAATSKPASAALPTARPTATTKSAATRFV